MNLTLRKAAERGHFRNEWLDSQHSFSFGEYYDPNHMGVSVLRVINDDKVSPNQGFGTHPHRDMEIITYVLKGQLQHRDSMGNGGIIQAGDVQHMSAGTGVKHSEFNPSANETVEFLQIWLLPAKNGVPPVYHQEFFAPETKQGQLKLIASPEGTNDSIPINSQARLYATLLAKDESVQYNAPQGRLTYVHIARGEAQLGEQILKSGDAVTLSAGASVQLSGIHDANILIFDLPA